MKGAFLLPNGGSSMEESRGQQRPSRERGEGGERGSMPFFASIEGVGVRHTSLSGSSKSGLCEDQRGGDLGTANIDPHIRKIGPASE